MSIPLWNFFLIECLSMRVPILLPLSLAVCFAQGSSISLERTSSASVNLRAGEMVEVSAGVIRPSQLPVNGRVAIEFGGYRKVVHALDPDLYMVYRAPKAGAYTLKATVVEDEEAIFNNARWREAGTIQKVSRFPKVTPWPDRKSVV